MKKKACLNAKKIALIAVMTACVEAAKLALATLPNVEVVTLLCSTYGYVFGGLGLVATSLFIVIETLIWGVNTWVISYVIHWNSVCLIFWILKKFEIKNIIVITATAVLLTVWFGVLTSLVDIGLFGGTYEDFGYRFTVYYTRGVVFYATQTACNLILFPIAFKPLTKALNKAKLRFFENKKDADKNLLIGEKSNITDKIDEI